MRQDHSKAVCLGKGWRCLSLWDSPKESLSEVLRNSELRRVLGQLERGPWAIGRMALISLLYRHQGGQEWEGELGILGLWELSRVPPVGNAIKSNRKKGKIAESQWSIMIMTQLCTRLYYGHYIPFLTVAFHDKDDYPDLTEEENEKQRIQVICSWLFS